MNKGARKLLSKIESKSDVSDHQEIAQLVRELIVEERQREARNLRGGHYRITDREIATRIFNDLIMFLDPADIAVVPHIILEGIWERPVTYAWQQALSVGDTKNVLDIGANFGYFGLLAANQINTVEGSNIVLFEANPNLVPYIEKTLSVNWFNKSTVVAPVAVADKKGTATLNVLKDYIGSSSLHTSKELESYLSSEMKIATDHAVEVPTVTIDDYCRDHKIKHIDLIKIDIEGYEDKAYKGMQKIVEASPDLTLFIEFTAEAYADPKKFYNQLLKDFDNLYNIGPNGEFIVPESNDYDHVIGGAVWTMLIFSKKQLA